MSDTGSYIFTMSGLTKQNNDGQLIFDNQYLSFFYKSKIGVCGQNGSGKSTLLKIMAGIEKEYFGDAKGAKNIKIGYLEQEPAFDPEKTVRAVISEGVSFIQDMIDGFYAVTDQIGQLMMEDHPQKEELLDQLTKQQEILQETIEHVDGWNLERRLTLASVSLKCPADHRVMNSLSGGEVRRVALCRLLLAQPDLLLLDEPTNHLDAQSVAWLETYLKNYTGTLLLVTHDRYFLDRIADWILEIEKGKFLPFKGNYSSWLAHKVSLSPNAHNLKKECAWLKNASQAKNQYNQARIAEYESRMQQVMSLNDKTIIIPRGSRLGQKVIDFQGVTKRFGDKLLIENFSCIIPAGAIVGIIGPNGVGKTTLFRMITQQEKPDIGMITVGETVSLGYVDQTRDELNDEDTVWKAISNGRDFIDLGQGQQISSRLYCAGFQFSGTKQQKKIGILSGGERNRVHMACMLKKGSNVLLLDEPTNDLDVDTIRNLEEALEDYAGTVIVVSHDRFFLDRMATHILLLEGNGRWIWCQGNYEFFCSQHGDVLDTSNVSSKIKKTQKNFS